MVHALLLGQRTEPEANQYVAADGSNIMHTLRGLRGSPSEPLVIHRMARECTQEVDYRLDVIIAGGWAVEAEPLPPTKITH